MYERIKAGFLKEFGRESDYVFSAPGRTEIGGNHTDHQHGCVLAAAVDLDVIAVVSLTGDSIIRIKSEGHAENVIDITSLERVPDEEGKSNSLIRGVAARLTELGAEISGLRAYTTSDVLGGSGLSSSAAFENLVGVIFDTCFNRGRAGAVEIAKAGQFAENVYFGKSSGLMDQLLSSVGGFVAIDFKDPSEPAIEPIQFSFAESGYCLCITDTKGSHADLTPDYSAVPAEMTSVAKALGCEVLREVDEDEFYRSIHTLREVCSDRAILRAAHFFDESRRAVQEAEALRSGELGEFFRIADESGISSATLLQNLYSPSKPLSQEIPLGLMLSRRILNGDGASRVHGGGFAGTIQAFVPEYAARDYAAELDRVFGEGSCHILRIRPVGAIEVTV